MIISFTKRLLTNQTNQTKVTELVHIATTSFTPFLPGYQPPDTVDYLCFLYVSSSVKTPLTESEAILSASFLLPYPFKKKIKKSV